ncbi:MAG: phosphatidate cytidylyltransferase [Aestuariivirga sp.]|uniref:phosphatidate cytidylyltransferase n=1 Tax=Aestuariivirga sp. TaxID=2650926 RepID=UPI0038D12680
MPQLTVGFLAWAVGFAFICGALLLAALSVIPATARAARPLWPVFASEAVIVAGGVAPWLLSAPLLLGCLMAAGARIGFESGTVHGLASGRPMAMAAALLLVLVCLFGWFAPGSVVLPAGLAMLLLGVSLARLDGARSLSGSLGRFLIFPATPFLIFAYAASQPPLSPLLLLAFFLVEIFDSFSLLGGKLFGKTPLVPRLSPKKTWEGLATGAFALLAVTLALSAWPGPHALSMLLIAVTVMIAALAGDLLGSAAKRRAGVKDYPPVMKVQGGLLDIVDSWIVAGAALAGLAAVMGWTAS